MADTGVDNSIRFDISYGKTIPGLLKVGVIGFSILGLICNGVYCRGSYGTVCGIGNWYYFHGTTCFVTSLILLILYLIRLPWVITIIPWYLAELIYCAIFCLFFFIGSLGTLISLIANWGYAIAARIFATLFGVVVTGCLGYDALLKFKAYKRGEVGPGRSSQTASSPQV